MNMTINSMAAYAQNNVSKTKSDNIGCSSTTNSIAGYMVRSSGMQADVQPPKDWNLAEEQRKARKKKNKELWRVLCI